MKVLALVFSWLIGCALLILGLVFLFIAPWGGAVLILASLFVLPPVRALAYAKTNKRITVGIRTLLVAVLFVGSIFLVDSSETHEAAVQEAQQHAKDAQVKVAQLAKQREENRSYFTTHRDQVIDSIKESISSHHYNEALTRAKKYYFINDPELNELYASANKSVAKQQEVEKEAQKLKEQSDAVTSIEQRVSQNEQRLKKYYASAAQVKQAELDIVQLAFIKAEYTKSKVASEQALQEKASRLLPRVSRQSRVMYASALEDAFMKGGINATVRAVGPDKAYLRISYALMSKVLVYKFQNEIELFKQAKPLGFTRIQYTNGFDGSMGETWTVKL